MHGPLGQVSQVEHVGIQESTSDGAPPPRYACLDNCSRLLHRQHITPALFFSDIALLSLCVHQPGMVAYPSQQRTAPTPLPQLGLAGWCVRVAAALSRMQG